MSEGDLLDSLWQLLTSKRETGAVQFQFAIATVALLLGVFAWRSIAPRLLDPTRPPTWLAWGRRALRGALVIAALCTSLQYFYGQRNDGQWLHRWDVYHQVFGAKYFAELGYFRTYECTWEIDQQSAKHFSNVEYMRDIATLEVRKVEDVVGERDCEQLFTPERREQFVGDIEAMWALEGQGMWKTLFGDKGFNGTPFHAWTLAQLLRGNDLDYWSLIALASIDVLLMLMAFGVVARVWDIETAAIAALFWAANFPNNFGHMGGSLLRFDYIAMLIFALAAMKRDRWALAGVCVAWASMVRAFPAVFAIGLAIKAGAELIATRQLPREYARFFLAYGAAILVMFGLSLTLTHGIDHWFEWIANIRTHTEHTRGFRVGFKHMFMLDGSLSDESRFVGWAAKTERFEPRAGWYWLAVLLLLAPLLLAVRKLDAVTFTALFATGGFLLFTIATRYYYAMMVLPILIDRPLLRDRKHLLLTALLVATATVLHALREVNPHVPFLYNTACTAVFTAWFVIVGVLLWLDPKLRDPKPNDSDQPGSSTSRRSGIANVNGESAVPIRR